MKKLCALALVFSLLLALPTLASAGATASFYVRNPDGATVYASPSSKAKSVGRLFCGSFVSEFDLSSSAPKGWVEVGVEWTAKPRYVKLDDLIDAYSDDGAAAHENAVKTYAVVVTEDAPVYAEASVKSKRIALHRAGTLGVLTAEVNGFYVMKNSADSYGLGFCIDKEDVRLLDSAPATVEQVRLFTASFDTYATYTSGGRDMVRPTALNADTSYGVWQRLGDDIQLDNGSFIPAAWTTAAPLLPSAFVTSDDPLSRLNVRYSADKDAGVILKLVCGANVSIVSQLDDWAFVSMNDLNGFVMTSYLSDTKATDKTALATTVKEVNILSNTGETDILPIGSTVRVLGVANEQCVAVSDDYLHTLSIPLEALNFGDYLMGTAKVKGAALNMRAACDTESDALVLIGRGQKVDVVFRGDKWTKVRFRGQTGYVLSKHLSFGS